MMAVAQPFVEYQPAWPMCFWCGQWCVEINPNDFAPFPMGIASATGCPSGHAFVVNGRWVPLRPPPFMRGDDGFWVGDHLLERMPEDGW